MGCVIMITRKLRWATKETTVIYQEQLAKKIQTLPDPLARLVDLFVDFCYCATAKVKLMS